MAEAKDRPRAGTQTISEIAFAATGLSAQALLFGVASTLIGVRLATPVGSFMNPLAVSAIRSKERCFLNLG